eukprot:2127017-Pyramimonas_sp.AAC.1
MRNIRLSAITPGHRPRPARNLTSAPRNGETKICPVHGQSKPNQQCDSEQNNGSRNSRTTTSTNGHN